MVCVFYVTIVYLYVVSNMQPTSQSNYMHIILNWVLEDQTYVCEDICVCILVYEAFFLLELKVSNWLVKYLFI